MEFVKAIKNNRDPKASSLPGWSWSRKLLNPLITALFHHYKDNVHSAQWLTRISLPVPPSVSLEHFQIPLRSDLRMEGMSDAQKSGTLNAEWIHYKGWRIKTTNPGIPERILLYAHGGAYFSCGPGSHRGILSTLSQHSGTRILSIDYRLAPQYIFPSALHDMLSAYLYLIDPPPGQPRFLPEQVMFGGDSAGGNLAVSALLWLRKEKYPLPAGLALMSPWLDASHTSPSYFSNAFHDYLPHSSSDPRHITKDRDHYFVPDNSFLYHHLVSPIFAKDDDPSLTILPPIMIHIGDAERIRDDGIIFQSRFKSAPIFIEMYHEMQHVFQAMSLVDSFSHLSLVRLGHFMESVFKQQPLSEKSRFLWIRLGHDPLPLTRPLTIVAHSKELALAHSPNEWNATRQAAFAREFQGLIDAEKGKENAPLDTLINMC